MKKCFSPSIFLGIVVFVGSYYLSDFETHSTFPSGPQFFCLEVFCCSHGFLLMCNLMLLSHSFEYFSLLCTHSDLLILGLWEIYFCFYVFGILNASCIWMAISFPWVNSYNFYCMYFVCFHFNLLPFLCLLFIYVDFYGAIGLIYSVHTLTTAWVFCIICVPQYSISHLIYFSKLFAVFIWLLSAWFTKLQFDFFSIFLYWIPLL